MPRPRRGAAESHPPRTRHSNLDEVPVVEPSTVAPGSDSARELDPGDRITTPRGGDNRPVGVLPPASVSLVSLPHHEPGRLRSQHPKQRVRERRSGRVGAVVDVCSQPVGSGSTPDSRTPGAAGGTCAPDDHGRAAGDRPAGCGGRLQRPTVSPVLRRSVSPSSVTVEHERRCRRRVGDPGRFPSGIRPPSAAGSGSA